VKYIVPQIYPLLDSWHKQTQPGCTPCISTGHKSLQLCLP